MDTQGGRTRLQLPARLAHIAAAATWNMIDDRLYHRNDRDDRTRARSDECAREKEAFVRGGTPASPNAIQWPNEVSLPPSLPCPLCV